VKRLVPSPTQIEAGLESMNRLLKQTGTYWEGTRLEANAKLGEVRW
jgi:hypothetical protein